MSLTRIGRAAALGAALFCLPAPAFAADEVPLPEQIVDIMNQLWAGTRRLRANHAKGLVTEGSFTPSGAGAALSTAALLQGAATPVTVRFSDATGLPEIRTVPAMPTRTAWRSSFHLADGSDMDIVANSLKLFPVATGEDVPRPAAGRRRQRPGCGQADAGRALHRRPPGRAAGVRPASPRRSSLARETYNGINAFVFVGAAGKRQPFRFRIAPVTGQCHLEPADAARQPDDFLMDEMGERLAKGRCRSACWRRSPSPATRPTIRPGPGPTTASWSISAASR